MVVHTKIGTNHEAIFLTNEGCIVEHTLTLEQYFITNENILDIGDELYTDF